MDVRTTLAASEYSKARMATEANPNSEGMGDKLLNYAEDFTTSLKAAESTAEQALLGEAGPHALVEALAQTQLAVETAVTVRNKVVEAYQEILRMPV